MKVGLLGFGKAGKAVALVILRDKDFSLEWVLRKKDILEHRSASEILNLECNDKGIIYSSSHITMDDLLDKHPVDFIIDFSTSSFINIYGKIAAKRSIKIISAISNYKKEEVFLLKELSKTTTVFWSPNITLGVNYLIFATKILKKIAPWVDIEIVEEHNKQKTSISGTALRIADALAVEKSEINSVRVSGIVSKHEVIFGFPNQTVRLVHEAITREAFGEGALLIAQNLIDKKEGFYNFEDVFFPLFSETLEKQ